MFTGLAARRTAAAVTAALVAVLLVTFGGPTRAPADLASSAGTSHAGTTAKAARIQALPPAHQHDTPLHLDLATTPPRSAPDVRTASANAAPEAVVVRTGSDRVTPTGRAPPAL